MTPLTKNQPSPSQTAGGCPCDDQGGNVPCAAHQSLDVPAWGIRGDGTICFLNRAAESVLGVREAAVLNQPWRVLLEQLDPAAAQKRHGPRGPAPTGIAGRTLSLQRQGQPSWFKVVALNVPTVTDQTACRVEAAIDVSQWMRIETYVRGIAQGQAEPPRTHHTVLTTREREVLDLLANGLTQHEIARKLFVSYVTVRTHVQRVLPKLGASSIQGAVARYLLGRESAVAAF